MNILIAASEVFPFSKTGGLADVTGALAQVLSLTKGHEVAVFTPRYRCVGGTAFSLKAAGGSYRVPVGDRLEPAALLRADCGKAAVYFVDNPRYFDRAELYKTKAGDYADNDERFIFFCRAALEGAKFAGFKPDVVFCHDWQSALIPAYLKTLYSIDAFFSRTASLITVHNTAYQGCFPRETLFKAGFSWLDFTPDRLEYYGGINFLKAGLVFADAIATVSPSYAREIQTQPEFGRGLEGVLRKRAADLRGILNGIDCGVWDPESDSYIPRGYDSSDFAKGKAAAKKLLQEKLGLEQNPDVPLAGIVSRLERNKGLDIAVNVIAKFSDKMQFAVLGLGEQPIQDGFRALSESLPGKVAFKAAYDEALAHLIYAASDIFLMPSRFEPCGLSQLIAMRYGSVPVVSKTGGLSDTITDAPGVANGFFLPGIDAKGLSSALEKALALRRDEKAWAAIVSNGMNADHSWDKSAKLYLELFEKITRRVRSN